MQDNDKAIDPCMDIHSTPSPDEVLERVFELYEFCWSYAQRSGKEIIFEIGTEEQSGSTNTQEELDYTLMEMHRFCGKNNLPKPTFVVIQTGTRVMEMRNVGSFDTPIRVAEEIPAEIQVPKMIEICKKSGMTLEGTLRKSLYKNGEYLDLQIFSILKEEYNG